MKQAILMNFKPKEVQKILNGEKTLAISKTMPKCKLPIDVYIYCSRGKVTMITKYDKLVRDNIPKIIEETGKRCRYHSIDRDYIFIIYLASKLYEEVDELEEVNITKKQKRFIYGGFEKRICLESVEDEKNADRKD